MAPVPYADIEAVLLDVGNTLISIDFDVVAAELRARGWPCEPSALRRAEAAARPGYSERVFVTGASGWIGSAVCASARFQSECNL